MNITMFVEGVLKSLVGDAPVPEGLGLYKALAAVEHRLILVTTLERGPLREWLRHQKLTSHIAFHSAHALDIDEHTLLRTLGAIRANGPIDLVIDADPGRCALAFAAGYSVMPLLVPAFARPSWRPDWKGTPRPWQELDSEVRRQRDLATQHPEQEES